MHQARAEASVRKYLNRYAEPEARIPLAPDKTYEHVLVVPALQESPHLLEGLRPALQARDALLILVVNANSGHDSATHAANQALIAQVLAAATTRKQVHANPPVYWLEQAGFDALLLDRASPGFRLPLKEGVGLARRIGSDVALALKARGSVKGNGFGCTDADVRLPVDYFPVGEASLWGATGAIFPFVHLPSTHPALTEATTAYELSLRYYVLGLAYAGSPYAYHALGSALYLSFVAYAQVRGFPKRRAGEDFYLLDKLAKLGSVRRLKSPTICIQARASARVPFGTGPGVQRLLLDAQHEKELRLFHPRGFSVLREVHASLSEFARQRDVVRVQQKLSSLPEAPALTQHLDSICFSRTLSAAATQSTNPAQLERRLRTWFDALRTLKLIHALRDGYYPPLNWHNALDLAPFFSPNADSLEAALEAARKQEQLLPDYVGVAPNTCAPTAL